MLGDHSGVPTGDERNTAAARPHWTRRVTLYSSPAASLRRYCGSKGLTAKSSRGRRSNYTAPATAGVGGGG
jgi:hypothetical protein